MIKKIFLAIASFMLVFVCCSAEARTLCDPPLQTDCIMPQWGQVDPDSDALNSDGLPKLSENSSAPASAPTLQRGTPNGGAHIRLAQLSTRTKTLHAPELLIGSGKRFEHETQALVRAIEHASFDAAGNLKSGGRTIGAAAEALRGPSKNNQLNLYIKTPSKLRASEREMLLTKVRAVNEVIEKSLTENYPGRKAPTS